jgi:subtilisin family serine protease
MRLRHALSTAALIVPLATGALVAAPVAAAATPAPEQAPLTTSQAQALSSNVTDKVIVVFKDQLPATPDSPSNVANRVAAVNQVQHGVVHELALTHARQVKSFQLLNAVAATVSPGEASRLSANPAVAQVVKDEPIPLTSSVPNASNASNAASGSSASSAGITPLPGACSPSGQVQLDPEAVEDIHAATQSGSGDAAQALGYTGAGVKVGFIADGIDVKNPDFIRADGQPVFVDYQDFSGTGTGSPQDGGEAFLDASSIAAQGRETYNVAGYAVGLDQPCNIRILGVAPGASLVGLNVFGSAEVAFNSVFLEAINYAVNVDHVNVLNESFGSNPFPDRASLDLTDMANDAAVAAGVTVSVSSGDAGVTDTIGSPATDPAVISAGASTTYRAYAQSGLGGITYPGVTGWLNDNISGLSSGGFDQAGRTVDIVAPGDLNWALCTPKPRKYADCTNFAGKGSPVELTGGTSEAAPLTSGVAALVIQAYAESHGGTDPTPAVVKQIIVSTAEDIAAPADQQGAGLLDAYQAVKAAASYPGATTHAIGTALLDSATQLNAVGQPGTTQQLSDVVTNDGAAPATVGVSSRTLGAYRSVDRSTVTLADSTGDLSVVKFTEPSGQARLDASIAYQGAGPSTDFNAAVNISLISPGGRLAETSDPQGTGNYSNAQVANPAAGTWTALIFGNPSNFGGTVGPVQFGASTATWAPFGTLSTSSLTLAPGASKTVTLTVPTPTSPGDQSGSVVLTNSAGPAFTTVSTIPVMLRSLVPTPAPSSTFTGTLTGGNGRQFNTGQSAYYQVSIPAGTPVLNAEITTPNAGNTFLAELVDPSTGEAASTASNESATTTSAGTTLAPQLGTQLHVLRPDPGTWTLVINFYNQVAGTALSVPFTVTLDQTPATATAVGLPDSASTQLTAGKAKTVDVKVTNHGTTPEAYFVDARLNHSAQLSLASSTGSAVTVPVPSTTVPQYLVPSHTTSITATATASAPIFFDYSWAFGDPDLISSSEPDSGVATGTFDSSAVASGDWIITPFQDGPDGKNGVTPVTAQTSLSATTAAFDPAVTSTTGDLWLASADLSAPLHAVIAAPGQTVTLPVTITASGAAGSTVQGTLYVDDFSPVDTNVAQNSQPGISPNASDVSAFSYEYTVAPAVTGPQSSSTTTTSTTPTTVPISPASTSTTSSTEATTATSSPTTTTTTAASTSTTSTSAPATRVKKGSVAGP